MGPFGPWLSNFFANYAGNVASQNTGITSITGAAVVIIALFVYWLGKRWRAVQQREGRSFLEPHHLILIGLGGAVLFLFIGLGGLLWQSLSAKATLTGAVPQEKVPTSPAPKRYTAYDIEHRLRVIDELHDALSNLMTESAAGERLAQGNTIFDRIKDGSAAQVLGLHSQTTTQAIEDYFKLTGKYTYLHDIYNAASSTDTDGAPLNVPRSATLLGAEIQEIQQRGQSTTHMTICETINFWLTGAPQWPAFGHGSIRSNRR